MPIAEISWEDVVEMHENGCIDDKTFNDLKAKINKSIMIK